MSQSPIRILIVDDEPMMIAGFEMLFTLEDDMVFIGSAKDGHEGISMARTCQPDVILMNYMMPRMCGDKATAIILSDYPDTKILIYSTIWDAILLNAWQAGAKGVLWTGSTPEKWLSAIRDVYHGRDGRNIIPSLSESPTDSTSD